MATGHQRQDELSMMDGCLLWGRRVVVPQILRELLLAELHVNEQNEGTCKKLHLVAQTEF